MSDTNTKNTVPLKKKNDKIKPAKQPVNNDWRDGWAHIQYEQHPTTGLESCICFLRNPLQGDSLYLPCMANAIRRTILADLPSYLPSRHSIQFIDTTSVLHSDMLSQRLHLCPVRMERLIQMEEPPTSILIQANIQNQGSMIQSVYLKDLMVEGFENPEDFWTNPSILWTRLQPGQSLQMNTTLEFGTSHTKDSGFQPCAGVRYTFTTSEDVLEAMVQQHSNKLQTEEQIEIFKKGHREQAVWKTQDGNPMEYVFQFDNLGAYPIQEVIPLACLILEKRFQRMSQLLERCLIILQEEGLDQYNKIHIPEQMKIETYSGEYNAFEITVFHENDTIMNEWTRKIRRDNRIEYIGYRMPHPQDPFAIVRIALNDKPTDTQTYLKNTLTVMKEYADEILQAWNGIRQQFRDRSPVPTVPVWEDWIESHIYEIIHE